jgi:hypothetical protein
MIKSIWSFFIRKAEATGKRRISWNTLFEIKETRKAKRFDVDLS